MLFFTFKQTFCKTKSLNNSWLIYIPNLPCPKTMVLNKINRPKQRFKIYIAKWIIESRRKEPEQINMMMNTSHETGTHCPMPSTSKHADHTPPQTPHRKTPSPLPAAAAAIGAVWGACSWWSSPSFSAQHSQLHTWKSPHHHHRRHHPAASRRHWQTRQSSPAPAAGGEWRGRRRGCGGHGAKNCGFDGDC